MTWMTENIYNKHARTDQELNKGETLNFINDFMAEHANEDEAGDFT